MRCKFISSKKIIFVFAMLLLLGNTINAHANSVVDTEKIIEEGYTEDGIFYTVYCDVSVSNGISPRIVVSQKMTVTVVYSGYVTPPLYYYFNSYVDAYNTTMKGTLVRGLTVQSNNQTRTTYSGTVTGTI